MSADVQAALMKLATEDVQALLRDVGELVRQVGEIRKIPSLDQALADALERGLAPRLDKAMESARSSAVASLAQRIERRAFFTAGVFAAGVCLGLGIGHFYL